MDDFTFPATAVAAEPADTLCVHHHHHRRLPFPHFASSPLWFPDPGVCVAPTPAPSTGSRGTVGADMEEQEATSSDAGRRSAAERGGRGEDDDDEAVDVLRGSGAGLGEEKMDMLWENFNEELEALRRTGSYSKAAAAAAACELSDTDSEAEERGRGCAPVLRASSRAGGTGQYYRRTGGSWVLLMRIFKRLFVVEKTVSAASRRRQAKAAQ
uniref:Uncharacterized protein n=1 Tax=Avena sativa TaxID=4498 RepID=A0ACD5UQN9_AVESA